jgi:hypothetical protein
VKSIKLRGLPFGNNSIWKLHALGFAIDIINNNNNV